jgi:hypothetical protein
MRAVVSAMNVLSAIDMVGTGKGAERGRGGGLILAAGAGTSRAAAR